MAVSTTTEIGIGMAVSRQKRTYKDYTSNSIPIFFVIHAVLLYRLWRKITGNERYRDGFTCV